MVSQETLRGGLGTFEEERSCYYCGLNDGDKKGSKELSLEIQGALIRKIFDSH